MHMEYITSTDIAVPFALYTSQLCTNVRICGVCIQIYFKVKYARHIQGHLLGIYTGLMAESHISRPPCSFCLYEDTHRLLCSEWLKELTVIPMS